ncbi:MAG: SusC/RagA family TonB-linked outer membrane protein, partial [Opitutaceae bacterium]|nr:SusC/RagA family TonB-linked outer membrane protein [Cytophagales bacterium]
MKILFTTGCLFLLTITVWGQKIISGQIIGKDKEAIIGVVILEKGTANGTTTDIEGNFSLSVAGDSSILVLSYIGFKTQEVVVGNQTNISITLDEDAKELDEVVIIGYGTVKKSDLTGSVTSLKPGDVKQVPSGNVLDAIQGKAAGVDITRASGETGKSPDIVIRGNRSITANNSPLYIVDGVQYSSIQDINPNDIQSMEVLKDASSTAIYGSRGANGVIIVTTKRGASGDVKVSINSYYGESSVAKWGFSGKPAYPVANDAEAYAQIKRENYRTTHNDQYGTDLQALGSDYGNYQNGIQNNYTKDLLHHGSQKDLQIGISGGSEKIKTYFSLDYYEERGLLKNDNLKRYTGRLN